VLFDRFNQQVCIGIISSRGKSPPSHANFLSVDTNTGQKHCSLTIFVLSVKLRCFHANSSLSFDKFCTLQSTITLAIVSRGAGGGVEKQLQ
jgi:hypothetical protein